MAASLLSSAVQLFLLRGTATDYSSASLSLLVIQCHSALTLPSSTRVPFVCAQRQLPLPLLVSRSEQKKEKEKRASSGRRTFEALDEEKEGESCLGRSRSSCGRRCCSRAVAARSSSSSSLHWQESLVTMDDRRKILRQKGCIVWITGLSGSGKSTVAFAMDRILNSMDKVSYVLDGDKIREGLCKDLGFSAEDRRENIRRVGETAALFADAGLITVVSFISPYERDRDRVRGLVGTGNFIEVFMDVPLEVCEQRDAKGLYKLARQGVIKAFTGIDDPYEKPVNPEIVIKAVNNHGVCISPDEMARIIIYYLTDKGFLSAE